MTERSASEPAEMTGAQARLLLVGQWLFGLGVLATAAQLGTGRPTWAVVIAFASGGLMFAGDGRRVGVPTWPRDLRAAAIVAGWPPVPVIVLSLTLTIASTASVLVAVLARRQG